jgi:uncharacterized protein
MKKTLIIGATTNPARYAYLAANRLKIAGHEIVLVGIKEGDVAGEKIKTDMPEIKDVHTVSLYVGIKNQPQYYHYILALKPQRIIFNPGTENPELFNLAKEKGIEPIEACTLVMLSVGNY